MKTQQFPHEGKRVETGPVQFGDDWPGVFIRGDNALYYAMLIRASLKMFDMEFLPRLQMQDLADILSSCDAYKGDSEAKEQP